MSDPQNQDNAPVEPEMLPPYFHGDSAVHRLGRLPAAPPWRRFDQDPKEVRGAKFRVKPGDEALELVDAALLLRRPILVTGKPGIGKSSLAYAVAHELDLGPVLVWPITSRSTLQQGLYTYDAVGRLQEAALRNPTLGVAGAGAGAAVTGNVSDAPPAPAGPPSPEDVGRYIRLGPLGTALLPWKRPRVLLIDEIDKSDIDLPNDLLHVFEEGRYEIPELARLPPDKDGKYHPVAVWRYKSLKKAKIRRGQVRCGAFPLVILTSNGEREFPPAFLRRCLRLKLEEPDPGELAEIVRAHFTPPGGDAAAPRPVDPKVQALIDEFVRLREGKDGVRPKQLATDQLLNVVYLLTKGLSVLDRETLKKALLKSLSGEE